jgi:hypothetical protein
MLDTHRCTMCGRTVHHGGLRFRSIPCLMPQPHGHTCKGELRPIEETARG